MRLVEIREIISGSQKEHWNKITCWGAGAGPSFHSRFMTSGTKSGALAEESHSNVAIYREDIDISIAWGMDMDWSGEHDQIKRDYEFTKNFLDKAGFPQYADVFYRGALVDREVLVSVDGADALIPLPRAIWGDRVEGSMNRERIGESVSGWQFELGRLVHSFEHTPSDYNRAIDLAGIEVDYGLDE